MGQSCASCQHKDEATSGYNGGIEQKDQFAEEDLEDSQEFDAKSPPSTYQCKTMEADILQFQKLISKEKEEEYIEEKKEQQMILDDQSRYLGSVVNGKANGYGKLWLENGDYYQGDFVENMMEGNGTFNYSIEDQFQIQYQKLDKILKKCNHKQIILYLKGPIYEGQFKSNKPDGYGIETWPDGSIYEGEFQGGRKHGKGCYKWHQGCVYNGEWKDNMIQQILIQSVDDKKLLYMVQEDTNGLMEGYGISYSGSWVKNQMHGRGKYIWKDGKCYDGEYQSRFKNQTYQIVMIMLQHDKKCGFGIFYWPDGKQFQGQWLNGRQHGKGVMLGKDGKKKIGSWLEGKLMSSIEDDNFQIIPEGWIQQQQ